MSKKLLIEFAGAPGAGKSTHAAYVYAWLKANSHKKVSLVEETATKEIYKRGGLHKVRGSYLAECAMQEISDRFVGGADIVVYDSWLHAESLYYPRSPVTSFTGEIVKEFRKDYTSVGLLVLKGVKSKYHPSGRLHNEEECDRLNGLIYDAWKETKYDQFIVFKNNSKYAAIKALTRAWRFGARFPGTEGIGVSSI